MGIVRIQIALSGRKTSIECLRYGHRVVNGLEYPLLAITYGSFSIQRWWTVSKTILAVTVE